MKRLNFWKTLAIFMLAVFAFSACNNNGTGGGGIESITVNGKPSENVYAGLEAGTTGAVSVVAAGTGGTWTISYNPADANSWISPSPASGGVGTTSLTFTLAAASAPRSAEVILTGVSDFMGIEIKTTATITIHQGIGPVEPNVREIRQAIQGIATSAGATITDDLTLTGIVATDVSGGGLGGNTSCVIVDPTIDPGAGLIVRITGYTFAVGQVITGSIKGATATLYNGVLQVSNASMKAVAGDIRTLTPIPVANPIDLINYESQLVKISNVQPVEAARNGTFADTGQANYKTTAFETINGGRMTVSLHRNNSWALEKPVPANSGSIIGIVAPFSGEGQIAPRTAADIDLTGEIFEISEVKGPISTIIGAGPVAKATVEDAVVVATHTQGILIGDNTGVMLAFIGAAPSVVVGDKVKVSGGTERRYGVIQFSRDGLTVEKTGTGTFTMPSIQVLSASDIDAYFATTTTNAVYKYVRYSGIFVVSGNYYNVTIPGTDVQGSVAYGKPEWSSFNGQPVVIEGWLLGGNTSSGTKFLQTMATSVDPGTDPFISATAPAEFAAAGGMTPVSFTAGNLGSNQIFAEISGTDASQFSYANITANSVDITALENNEETSKTATLKLYIAASAGGTPLASSTVTLTQKAKNTSGTETEEIIFANQGWGNSDKVTSLTQGNITLNFSKASGTTDPAFYTTGSALRIYAGNTMKVSGATIVKIEFTFVAGDYNNWKTWSTGSYEGTVWTGSAENVTFTSDPGTPPTYPQTRIVSMIVTYKGGSVTPTPSISIPSAPVAFDSPGSMQTVSFTTNNLGTNQVFAEITGTDAAQFSYANITANSVDVTAIANTGAAKAATLTLYIAATQSGERLATASTDLMQHSAVVANFVELTQADIAAANITGSAYIDKTFAAADGSSWSGFILGNATRLQLGWNLTPTQSAARSNLLSPVLPSDAVTVIITPEATTAAGRVFALLPKDFVYNGETADEVKAMAYAISPQTVAGSTTPLTFSAGSAGTQFQIRAVSGAVYFTNVRIEY